MAVVFGHDTQIKVDGGHGSAAREHDLHIGSIEYTLNGRSLFGLQIFHVLD